MHAHRWTVKNKGQAKPNFKFNHKCMKYGLLDSYKINVHNQSLFFSRENSWILIILKKKHLWIISYIINMNKNHLLGIDEVLIMKNLQRD